MSLKEQIIQSLIDDSNAMHAEGLENLRSHGDRMQDAIRIVLYGRHPQTDQDSAPSEKGGDPQ